MGLIGAMIGESKYFETTTPSRDVWGDFNSRMADSFFINLDELSRKESIECEGKIKGLITNPRMTINEKGVKQYAIKSFHRFAGTTNNEDPLKTTKDDRRNLIINVSNELIGNTTYFNKWNELMKNVNFIKTCYEYFKSIPDMQNFNKIPLPQTEYQLDMKDASISPIEMWIKSFVLDNYYETAVELLGSKLFELFKSWCKQCGMDYNLTLPAFGLRLKRLNVNGIEKGKHTNKGETKIFNIAVLKDHFKLIDIVKDTNEDDENYEGGDM
jgi:phage/plasmid-associated DNA primase